MNRKGLLLSLVVMAANMIIHNYAYSDPIHLSMRFSLGVLDAREDPVNLANLGEEFFKLHFALGGMFTMDFPSIKRFRFALEGDVWSTWGSSGGVDLSTMPILFGARACLFPSSPVRLYGTGGAGVCISKRSWKEKKPFLIFWTCDQTVQEQDCSFAYGVGGGIELLCARKQRLFSIDYRYLAAGSDGRLGGHLLCLSYGFYL